MMTHQRYFKHVTWNHAYITLRQKNAHKDPLLPPTCRVLNTRKQGRDLQNPKPQKNPFKKLLKSKNPKHKITRNPTLIQDNTHTISSHFPKMAMSATYTTTNATTHRTSAVPKPYFPSKLPFSFRKFTSSCPSAAKSSSFAVSCTLRTRDPAVQMEHRPNEENGSVSGTTLLPRPDSFGRFGKFGGKYVPETLMHALTELESAFYALAGDEEFQVLLI